MKKFLSVALVMFIVTTTFLVVSNKVIGDKQNIVDGLFVDTESRQKVEFLKYEKTDREHQIYVTITNNWNEILDVNDLSLSFAPTGSGSGYSEFRIDGYEYNDYSQGYSEIKMGMEPGESRVYVFKIPLGISFDKEVYDFNKMSVMGQVIEYYFRINDNSLYGGLASWTIHGLVQNSGEPIIIDSN